MDSGQQTLELRGCTGLTAVDALPAVLPYKGPK